MNHWSATNYQPRTISFTRRPSGPNHATPCSEHSAAGSTCRSPDFRVSGSYWLHRWSRSVRPNWTCLDIWGCELLGCMVLNQAFSIAQPSRCCFAQRSSKTVHNLLEIGYARLPVILLECVSEAMVCAWVHQIFQQFVSRTQQKLSRPILSFLI